MTVTPTTKKLQLLLFNINIIAIVQLVSSVSVVYDVGAVSLKNGVSLPPIPDFNLYVETPCSSLDTDHEETPVEYLIPLGVSGTRTQETAEYRLVTCPQSLTTWRPLSNSL